MWIEFRKEFLNEFAFQLENLNTKQEVHYIDTSKKKNVRIFDYTENLLYLMFSNQISSSINVLRMFFHLLTNIYKIKK